MTTPTLFAMPSSGNSYKVRLLLALNGQAARIVPLEAGTEALASAKAEGQAPLGTLPALHLPCGSILSESGAILWYLGQNSAWVPADPLAQARTLSWMFFEQNRHEPVIAVRAALRCYPHRAAEATSTRMADLLERGHAILAIMEAALIRAPFFGGEAPTIADIALYGYTHTAGTRGGFEMDRFPAVTEWCDRIAGLPGYLAQDAAW